VGFSRNYLPRFHLQICRLLPERLNRPGIEQLMQQIESVLAFFVVVEAKQRGLQLEDCIPQVLI
jgi:hypothetical protein